MFQLGKILVLSIVTGFGTASIAANAVSNNVATFAVLPGMSIGFALRERYPIDENCKPIDKYGSLGLFRSHEIPKIDAIVVDKPGLNVACGAIGIGEITSIPTAPAIADAYFRWNGERQYSLPLTGTPYERKC